MNRNQLVEMVIGYKVMIENLDALERYKPPFTEAERNEIKEALRYEDDCS